MMALAGVEPETLVSEPDALTTRPFSIWCATASDIFLLGHSFGNFLHMSLP